MLGGQLCDSRPQEREHTERSSEGKQSRLPEGRDGPGRQGAGGGGVAPSLIREADKPDCGLTVRTGGSWVNRPTSHRVPLLVMGKSGGKRGLVSSRPDNISLRGCCLHPPLDVLLADACCGSPPFPFTSTILHSYLKAALEEKLIKYKLILYAYSSTIYNSQDREAT